MADATRRSTGRVIELTATELRDSTGVLLARVEDIESMDRGVFAFKPSNGFLLKTKKPGKRAWQPGLWWRIGNRVGVGGVTSAAQAKFMAEQIAFRLSTRET